MALMVLLCLATDDIFNISAVKKGGAALFMEAIIPDGS
jgi:hypothetical protein